jgi:hypothetical protein
MEFSNLERTPGLIYSVSGEGMTNRPDQYPRKYSNCQSIKRKSTRICKDEQYSTGIYTRMQMMRLHVASGFRNTEIIVINLFISRIATSIIPVLKEQHCAILNFLNNKLHYHYNSDF